jgi:hypothetical protein
MSKFNFKWQDWRPAGWSDDLGIIADRNTWVSERRPGWKSPIPPSMHIEVTDWCKKNLRPGSYIIGVYTVLLANDESLMWFKLRWS